MLHQLLDFILHINDHLATMVQEYGVAVYGILFLIIFVETGLVVMPFLPGDSLLFAAGALCANEATGLNLGLLILLLTIAAIAGDNANYFIGKTLGLRVTQFQFRGRRLVKQKYIDDTHQFFEKHGTKAIIMARFCTDCSHLHALCSRLRPDGLQAEIPSLRHCRRSIMDHQHVGLRVFLRPDSLGQGTLRSGCHPHHSHLRTAHGICSTQGKVRT